MSADNEMWQVLLSGDITDVDLGTLKQWIAEGKVQKTDKVRKGGGSWVDVARTPALRAALSNLSQQQSAPAPVIQVQDNTASASTIQTNYEASAQGYNIEASENAVAEQPYLPTDQPYLPADQPYLDPNKDYNAQSPELPAPQATGTVFQGEAPPQKYLQAETLPDSFRSSGAKPIKRVTVEEYDRRMKSQQSLGGLIGTGLIGGGLGVLIWCLYAQNTQSKSYFLSLGIGYAIGALSCRLARCYDNVFGLITAFFAVLTSFIGQLLGLAIILALEKDVPRAQVFSHLEIGAAFTDMMSRFGLFNLVMYLGAGYIAYYFCFRTDTEMD